MTQETADARLQRLLVMIPWVTQHDGPTVEQVCTRFSITEADLAADLELLFMCGLYPFTPDALIEADIVDGRVWIRFADSFERPPTFTREEAVSILAAAAAVSELPQNEANDALKSALRKLARALGIDDDDVVAVELAPTKPDVLDLTRQAANEHRLIELDYYSNGRDAWSRREVEIYRTFNRDGQWYVQGRAPEADEVRTFRIDRMRNVALLDERFQPSTELPEPQTFAARPTDPTVTLALAPNARWVSEQYPTEHVETRDDGTLLVTLKVSEEVWLQRLLLRLGASATVVEGAVDVTATAQRILNQYQEGASK